MNLLSPLIYLRLRNASGALVIRRDLLAWVFVGAILAVPCIVFPQINFFHSGGLLDKIGTFSSVLIGFYVAALIGVATLNSSFADLDRKIVVGVVRRPSSSPDDVGDDLSRREYICLMFGYMAFIALIIALSSLIVLAVVPVISPFVIPIRLGSRTEFITQYPLRVVAIILYSAALSSLAITTVRGLYYLMDRIYYVAPTVDQSRDLNSNSASSSSQSD